jgi:hypothetical protein
MTKIGENQVKTARNGSQDTRNTIQYYQPGNLGAMPFSVKAGWRQGQTIKEANV